MNTQIERYKKILYILSERKHETVIHLAKELGVDPKTIWRDIKALRTVFPVYTVRGVGAHVPDDFSFDGNDQLNAEDEILLQEMINKVPEEDKERVEKLLNKIKRIRLYTKIFDQIEKRKL